MSKIVKTFQTGDDQAVNDFLELHKSDTVSLNIFTDKIVINVDTDKFTTAILSYLESLKKSALISKVDAMNGLKAAEEFFKNEDRDKRLDVNFKSSQESNDGIIKVQTLQISYIDALIKTYTDIK